MGGGRFTLKARIGPRVRREQFGSLDEALAALEREVAGVGQRRPRSVLGRDYEPVKQVAGRLEIHGPDGAHGGVDVRGDGSAEAYRGWIRKRLIQSGPGEAPVDALRRELVK